MVVWDNVEVDIKPTMTEYFAVTVANKDPNSADAVRWDKLHVKVFFLFFFLFFIVPPLTTPYLYFDGLKRPTRQQVRALYTVIQLARYTAALLSPLNNRSGAVVVIANRRCIDIRRYTK